MARKYLTLLVIILAIIFPFFSSVAHAQVRETDIALSLSPQFPSPNQNVTASLTSYTTNLDKALISWSVDGQIRASGVGKKSFFASAGATGSTTNITATINTLDGTSLVKNIAVTPTDVDLLWQANDSYTPPFYKGKALAPSQGEFKVVAIPNLTNQNGKISPNNLSYVWSKDGNMQPDSSGWGQNSYLFSNSYLDKNNVVNVKVSDITGAVTSSGSMTLETMTPKIIFYERNSLLGTEWENSLKDGFRVDPNGTVLVAEPFFFSPRNINSDSLTFDWSLNGQGIQTPFLKNSLAVKPEAGKSGNSLIKVIVNNANTLFQSAEGALNVIF